MKYEPYEYQSYIIEYIKEHPVSAIFLDMGLGKTSIALTALYDLLFDGFEVSRVLVVAPLRVALTTWGAEIEKWEHLKGLRYSVVVGSEAERIKALKTNADIYIINRENVYWLTEKTDCHFDMLVIDELSSFKNHQAKRFKAMMRLRPYAKRVVGLTGTPASNGLMDLFAEFKLLDMGERFGRFIGKFRETYFSPDKRNGNFVFSYKPKPGAEDVIYEKISDITVSMKAVDYIKMPELIRTEYRVELSSLEKQKYTELKENLVLNLQGGEVTAANVASLSGKLSQLANGAVYSDDDSFIELHHEKLDALEDIIESANGKPVLVAYWFRHDLKRITDRLAHLKIPCGQISSANSINSWNKGEIPVGLIHPASAGHGLNLQSGGSHLVWFGLTWSLELYQQTNARLWRQGQNSDTVVIQHIVAKGTIDEYILKALSDKDSTQSALISAVKASLN